MANQLSRLEDRLNKLRVQALTAETYLNSAAGNHLNLDTCEQTGSSPLLSKAFDESKHSRDKGGKFSETAGAKLGAKLQHKLSQGGTDIFQVEVGGKKIPLFISPEDNGHTLYVDFVGDEDFRGSNSVGPGAMRSVLAQIKAHYPEAKRIAGERVSGARERARVSNYYTSVTLRKRLEKLRAALLATQTILEKEFREADHPRAQDGRFSAGMTGETHVARKELMDRLEALRNVLNALSLRVEERYTPVEKKGNPYHDEHGRFTTGPGGTASEHPERAYTGGVKRTRKKLSKLETGHVGEYVVAQHLKLSGAKEVRTLNVKGNNFPLDLIAGNTVVEVKAGLVSNDSRSARWRTTLGEPGKAEKAWAQKASLAERSAWNDEKVKRIIARKKRAMKRLEKQFGKKLKAKTIAVIIDPDKKIADVHEFDGFHTNIGWKSPQTKRAYRRTIKYND